MNDFTPSTAYEGWHIMNRVYYHLRQQEGPREAKVLVNKLAGELFEEMFKEAA